jgi:hypothetical protein
MGGDIAGAVVPIVQRGHGLLCRRSPASNPFEDQLPASRRRIRDTRPVPISNDRGEANGSRHDQGAIDALFCRSWGDAGTLAWFS